MARSSFARGLQLACYHLLIVDSFLSVLHYAEAAVLLHILGLMVNSSNFHYGIDFVSGFYLLTRPAGRNIAVESSSHPVPRTRGCTFNWQLDGTLFTEPMLVNRRLNRREISSRSTAMYHYIAADNRKPIPSPEPGRVWEHTDQVELWLKLKDCESDVSLLQASGACKVR